MIEGIQWTSRKGEVLKGHLQTIARALARWSFDHTRTLRDIEPSIPDGLHDRAADNWSPLLTKAPAIGGLWIEQAHAAAVALSTNETKTEPRGVELLHDLAEMFRADDRDRYPSQGMCDALALLEERPWGDYRQGKPLNQNQLAKLLKPFGISSRTIRIEGHGTARGYLRTDFDDAFIRYLPPLPPDSTLSKCNSDTTRAQSGDTSLFQGDTEGACVTSENGLNPAPRAECVTVSLQNPQMELEEVIDLVD